MDISYKDEKDANKNIDIIVLANFSATSNVTTTADVKTVGTWFNYLTGEQINIRRKDHVLTLKPGELVILTSRKVNNAVSIDETLADDKKCIVLPTIAEDNITIIAEETPASVEVINLSGNVVAKAENTDNISVDGLAKGHYIVRVLIDDTISTHRIIKK
jgi:hypothetical protein